MPLLGKAEEYLIMETLMAKLEICLSQLQHKLFQNTGTWATTSTIFKVIQQKGFTLKNLSRLY